MKLNDVFVFRLADYVPEYAFPLRELAGFVSAQTPGADVQVIAADGGTLYTQYCVLKACAPLLAMESTPGGPAGASYINYLLRLSVSLTAAKELFRYIYTDEITAGADWNVCLELLTLAGRFGLLGLKSRVKSIVEASMSLEVASLVGSFCTRTRLSDDFQSRLSKLSKQQDPVSKQQSALLSKAAGRLALDKLRQKCVAFVSNFWTQLQASGQANSVPGEIAIEASGRGERSRTAMEPGGCAFKREDMMVWMYEAEEEKDFTLVATGEGIKAHTAVLFATSEYFRSLLQSGLRESRRLEVSASDHSPADLRALVKFLYLGPGVFSGFDLQRMLTIVRAADYYQVVNNDAK